MKKLILALFLVSITTSAFAFDYNPGVSFRKCFKLESVQPFTDIEVPELVCISELRADFNPSKKASVVVLFATVDNFRTKRFTISSVTEGSRTNSFNIKFNLINRYFSDGHGGGYKEYTLKLSASVNKKGILKSLNSLTGNAVESVDVYHDAGTKTELVFKATK